MSDLVFYPPPPAGQNVLFERCASPLSATFADTQDVAAVAIRDARGFIGKLTPELLKAAKRLEWVQSRTASLEHYLFPELVAHSCDLTNTAGIFGDVIAEHVLGYLLTLTRNLHLYRDRQHNADYRPVGAESLIPDFVGGPSICTDVDRAHARLSDRSYLMVGLGDIGRTIVSRLHPFGVMPDAVDPRDHALERGRVFAPHELPNVIGRYDVVVIAAPHTPDTEGLFDDALLARMKPGSWLVNIGRGAIIKTDALVDALNRGHLGAAAIDVLEDEPLAADSPLWGMENVLLTPHVAACCPVIAERHRDIIAENVRRFAAGQPLRNVVDKTMWC